MPTKEELTKLVFDYYTHEARCKVLNDVVRLLEKYEHKITRAYNDSKRKTARINKSDQTKRFHAIREEDVLQCQMIEVMKLENEFMKRTIEATDEKNAHFDKLEAYAKQIIDDDFQEQTES